MKYCIALLLLLLTFFACASSVLHETSGSQRLLQLDADMYRRVSYMMRESNQDIFSHDADVRALIIACDLKLEKIAHALRAIGTTVTVPIALWEDGVMMSAMDATRASGMILSACLP